MAPSMSHSTKPEDDADLQSRLPAPLLPPTGEAGESLEARPYWMSSVWWALRAFSRWNKSWR